MFSWCGRFLLGLAVLGTGVQGASLFDDGSGAEPLITAQSAAFVPVAPTGLDGANVRSSLFSGRQGRSMFAPVAVRLPVDPVAALNGGRIKPLANARGVTGLLDLIASAEAGPAGYNAVVWSAKIKTPKPPTAMTLDEIYRWIEQTPNQNHAIGRYQFIPNTLRSLVKRLGLPKATQFSPHVQDQLANLLLEDAGYSEFAAGKMSHKRFMNNLAKIWAGLPTSNGKSHYDGLAGNKAVLTWARFEASMFRIFPS